MRSMSTLGARRQPDAFSPRHAVGRRIRRSAIALVLISVALPCSLRAQAAPIERLSNRSNGQSGEGRSQSPVLSVDARFAVFASAAIDLVSGDRNQNRDVFLADRKEDTIFRISVAPGAEANGNSELDGAPSISDDGCVVAFSSKASNLVAGDGNARDDVFVIDCLDQVIRRVSVGIGAEANGTSTYTDLSSDGRFVVFQSAATNLIDNDGNSTVDIFVFDRETGVTRRASVASDGVEANAFSVQPSISGDGRFVIFASDATNLVEGDTNATRDIFVHELSSGETTRVSVSSSGLQANGISFFPVLDFDGSIAAFKSEATNLEGVGGDTNGFPDVFVHDRGTGETVRVSEDSFGNEARDGLSSGPGLSADGRFVAFASGARNLVAEDGNLVMDVFVVDRSIAPQPEIRVVALADDDNTGGAPDVPVSVSANGRWIGFSSAALLLPFDVNNDFDAYVACNPFDPTLCASEDPPTPTPTPSPTPPGFCNSDDDCEPPQVCVDHMCVDPTPTPTPPGFCTDNDDCPPPQVCIDMMCTDPTPTPTTGNGGGGGGGCSCKIDPETPAEGLDALAVAVPALLLLLRRRVRRRVGP